MEKLKKSTKVILLSIVSAVCVLGIVLGIIFSTHTKNNSGSNPSVIYNGDQNNPVTWEQKLNMLGKEVDDVNTENKYKVFSGMPYNGFVDEQHLLKELTENYFVVFDKVSGKYIPYLYYEENGATKVLPVFGDDENKSLFVEDGYSGMFLLGYSGKYIIFRTDISSLKYKITVIDAEKRNIYAERYSENEDSAAKYMYDLEFSEDGKTVVFYEENPTETDLMLFDVSLKEFFKLFTFQNVSYNENLQNNDEENGNLDNEIIETETIRPERYVLNNGVVLDFPGKEVRVFSEKNGNVGSSIVATYNENQRTSSVNKLSENFIVVELATSVYGEENKKATSVARNDEEGQVGEYLNYEYRFISTTNGNVSVSNYFRGNDIAKMSFEESKKYKDFYVVFEQKVSDNILLPGGNIFYFYKDGTEVISFEIQEDEKLIGIIDKSVLTNNKLFSFVSNNNYKEDKIFVNDKNLTLEGECKLISTNIVDGIIKVIFVKSDGSSTFGILNTKGEISKSIDDFIDSKTGNKITIENFINFSDEIIFVSNNNKYYKLNFETFKCDEIKNYSSNEVINKLNQSNYTFYLTENTLKDYSNNFSIENISHITTDDNTQSCTVLNITSNNIVYSMLLYNIKLENSVTNSSNINDIKDFSNRYSNDIQTYNYTVDIYYYGYYNSSGNKTSYFTSSSSTFHEEFYLIVLVPYWRGWIDFNVTSSIPQRTGYTFVDWYCEYDSTSYGSDAKFYKFFNYNWGFPTVYFVGNWKENTYTLVACQYGGVTIKEFKDILYTSSNDWPTATGNPNDGYFIFSGWINKVNASAYEIYTPSGNNLTKRTGSTFSKVSSSNGSTVYYYATWRLYKIDIIYYSEGDDEVTQNATCTSLYESGFYLDGTGNGLDYLLKLYNIIGWRFEKNTDTLLGPSDWFNNSGEFYKIYYYSSSYDSFGYYIDGVPKLKFLAETDGREFYLEFYFGSNNNGINAYYLASIPGTFSLKPQDLTTKIAFNDGGSTYPNGYLPVDSELVNGKDGRYKFTYSAGKDLSILKKIKINSSDDFFKMRGSYIATTNNEILDYEVVGWALYGASKDENGNNIYDISKFVHYINIKDSTNSKNLDNTQLSDYIKNTRKDTITNDGNATPINRDIKLFAIFAKRAYKVAFATKNVSGATPVLSDINGNSNISKNDFHLTETAAEYAIKYSLNDNQSKTDVSLPSKGGSTSYATNVGFGNSIEVDISLSASTSNFYYLGRIELQNYTWRTGANDSGQKCGTFVLRFNQEGKCEVELFDSDGKSIEGYKKDFIVGDNFYINENLNKIDEKYFNTVSLKQISNSLIKIVISNCNIARPYDQSVGSTDEKPTQASVTSAGEFGFKVMAYACVKESVNDRVEIVNSNLGNFESSQVESVGNGSKTAVGRYIVVPVKIVTAQSYFTFWLNGRQYVIWAGIVKPSDTSNIFEGAIYKQFATSATNYNSLNSFIGKTYRFKLYDTYNSQNVAAKLDKFEEVGLGNTSDDENGLDIYVDSFDGGRNFVGYINTALFDSDLNYANSGDKIIDQIPNYGNSELFVFRPKQEYVYSSSNINTVTETNHYELQAYISLITINGIDYKLNQLRKDYSGTVTKSEYSDYVPFLYLDSQGQQQDRFTGTNMPSIFQNGGYNYTFYYRNTKYNIVNANELNHSTISGGAELNVTIGGTPYRYLLYLGINSDTGEYLYFLIGAGNDSNGTLKEKSVIKVKVEFEQITNKISLTTALSGSDDYYNVKTDGVIASYEYVSKDKAKTSVDLDSGSYANKVENKVEINSNPTQTYIFSFIPEAGYLIDSVSLKLNNNTIISYTLNKKRIGTSNETDYKSNLNIKKSDFSYSYCYYGPNNGSEETSNIKLYYDMDTYNTRTLKTCKTTEYCGIYYSTDKTDHNKWNGNSMFESFYILVSGIYHSVKIEVKTISFFEMVIEDDDAKSLLGLIPGNGVGEASLGKLSLAYRDISSNSWKELNSFYFEEKSDSEVVLHDGSKTVSYNYDGETLTRNGKEVGRCSFEDSLLTVFINDVENKYTFENTFVKQGDSNIYASKLYSENFNIYEAVDKKHYRLSFLGYADTFKYGMAFTASNVSYSYYFDNAKFYASTDSNNSPFNYLSEKTDDSGKKQLVDSVLYEDGLSDYDSSNRNQYQYLSVDYHNINNQVVFGSNKLAKNGNGVYQYSIDEGLIFGKGNKSYNSSSDLARNFILSYKYMIILKVHEAVNNVKSESYLAASGYSSIVDNPTTKQGTWFNDTVVTNINYYNNGNKAQNLFGDNDKAVNWQDVFERAENIKSKFNYVYYKDNYDNFVSIYKSANGNINSFKNLTLAENKANYQVGFNEQGYGIGMRYFVIPGYYLSSIKISGGITLDIDVTSKIYQKKTLQGSKTIYDNYNNYSAAQNSKFSYSITIGEDFTYGTYFDFYIYNVDNLTISSRMNNLKVISNPIKIDFYSSSSSILVTYHENKDKTEISSSCEFDGSNTQEFMYDRMKRIERSLKMTGYSFIGWGSEEIGDNLRIGGGSGKAVTWNTSSSWTELSSYFTLNKRADIVPYGDSNSPVGYDFYTDGAFFITDSGWKSRKIVTESYIKVNSNDFYSNGYSYFYKNNDNYVKYNKTPGQDSDNWKIANDGTSYVATESNVLYYANEFNMVQNYNFWNVYFNEFNSNIDYDLYFDQLLTDSYLYKIDLYAIWKANTYVVEIDLNDPENSRDNGKNQFARNSKDRIFKESAYEVILPSIGLSYYTTTSEENDKYYFYVTFDTNDWYVLKGRENYTSYIKKVNDNNVMVEDTTQKIPLTDFVVDRYGYSWLGWFTTKLNKVFQYDETGYYSSYSKIEDRKTYMGGDFASEPSRAYATAKYTNGSADSGFITLNYAVYNRVAGKNSQGVGLSGNITELKDVVSSHFGYLGEYLMDDNRVNFLATTYSVSVFTETNIVRINGINYSLTGNYKEMKYGEGSVYFYKYANSSRTAPDYLNEYVDSNVAIFDTALDYRYYERGIEFSYKWNTESKNYRYLRLYSYWETNLYNIVVDYRDNTSLFGVGSSTVDGKYTGNILPIYYGDERELSERLKKFMPNRIGYDFEGWAFGNWGSNKSSMVQYDTNLTTDMINSIYIKSNAFVSSYNSGSQYSYIYFDSDYNAYKTYGKTSSFFNTMYLFKDGGLTPYGNAYADTLRNSQNKLEKKSETLGEDDNTDHYIYIYAVWKAQTFTINVSLNIDPQKYDNQLEKLRNGYDKDSEYVLSIYDSYNALGIPQKYVGYKSSYGKTGSEYTNIVANAIFEVTFDDLISNAKLVVDSEKKPKTIKDLFAISSGYYFSGWYYDIDTGLKENLTTGEIVSTNNFNSSFDGNENLVNENHDDGKTAFTIDDEITINGDEIVWENATYYVNNGKLYRTRESKVVVGDVISVTYSDEVLDLSYTVGNANTVTINHSKKFDVTLYNQLCFERENFGGENNASVLLSSRDYNAYYQNQYSNSRFRTMNYSSSESSNFGYVVVSNVKHYIYTRIESISNLKDYVMFYYDSDGLIKYLHPVITTSNTDESLFDFDNSNFYYDGYPIMFYSEAEKQSLGYNFNAYYIPKSYSTSERVNLNIIFKSNGVAEIQNPETNIHFEKTRVFTIYAKWTIKKNTVEIENANNSGISPDSNPGLAGFYEIKSNDNHSSYAKGSDVTVDVSRSVSERYISEGGRDSGQNEIGINLTSDFNSTFDVMIAPYFDGRFLSEMTIEFYSLEEGTKLSANYGKNNRFVSYDRIKYVISLKFTWDSALRTIKVTSNLCTVTRDGIKVSSPTPAFAQAVINYLTASNFEKMSILDKEKFTDDGNFINIGDYKTATIQLDEGDLDSKRIDINILKMKFNELNSDVKIKCKFSVQTFNLEVYNVFDPVVGNLVQDGGDYKTPQYKTIQSLISHTTSAYSASGALTYESSLIGATQMSFNTGKAVSTISIDSAKNTKSYNVPYGGYIYGLSDISVVSNDNFYNTSDYSGYRFIYRNGYYFYGSMPENDENRIKSESEMNKFTRTQFFEILGTKSENENSVRESSLIYTFVNWFEPVIESDVSFSLVEYGQSRESTAVNSNRTIIGYYYVSSKPISVNFYIWNDKTDSYTAYTENIEQYKISSTSTSKYLKQNKATGKLSVDTNVARPFDENGNLIITLTESYGVDTATFDNTDTFRFSEIGGEAQSSVYPQNLKFVNMNLIRDYWFYNTYRTKLYRYLENGDVAFIKYNSNIQFVVSNANTIEWNGTTYYVDKTNEKIYKNSAHTQAVTFGYTLQKNGDNVIVFIDDARFYYLDTNGHTHYITLNSSDYSGESDTAFTIYGFDVDDPEQKQIMLYHTVQTVGDEGEVVEATAPVKEYTNELIGSNMYCYIVDSYSIPRNKYYPIYSINENTDNISFLTSQDKATIAEVKSRGIARFFVKINGALYFMVVAGKGGNNVVAQSLWTYGGTSIQGEPSWTLSNLSVSVKNIDNYYFRLDDNFYEVQYALNYEYSSVNDNEIVSIYYSPDTSINYQSINIVTYLDASNRVYDEGIRIVSNSNYFYDLITKKFYYYDENKNFIEVKVNTCVAMDMAGGGTRLYYYNYMDSDFYYIDEEAGMFRKVYAKNFVGRAYSVYTPVNDNYTLNIELEKTQGITGGDPFWKYKSVNIKALPSPNSGFWYNNESYGYVGYIVLTDDDVDYIRQPDEIKKVQSYNGVKFDENDKIYTKFKNHIDLNYIDTESDKALTDLKFWKHNDKIVTAVENGNKFDITEIDNNGFSTTFVGVEFAKMGNGTRKYSELNYNGTYYIRTGVYADGQGNSFTLSFGEETEKLGIVIGAKYGSNDLSGFVGPVSGTKRYTFTFEENESSFTLSDDYKTISFKGTTFTLTGATYSNGSDKFAVMSKHQYLMEQVTSFCLNYSLGDLLGQLITVKQFYTRDNDKTVVFGVDMLIPVTIKLDDGVRDSDGNVVYKNITLNLKYNIPIIDSTTEINKTLYAVPIYSKNIVEFTESSVTIVPNNVTIGDYTYDTVNIETEKMFLNYYEENRDMITRFYDRSNDNFLKFVTLTEAEYKALCDSNNYTDKLNSIISNTDKWIYSEDRDGRTVVVSGKYSSDAGSTYTSYFGRSGTYYIVGYYNKYNDTTIIRRASDNVIKVSVNESLNISERKLVKIGTR